MAARVMGIVVALGVLAGVGVVVSAPQAEASTVRSVGSEAVDDVIAAARASARPDCGLTADRLAAMLLAPVFHETGAVWTPGTSPSPMTLGRWDDQAALRAFGDRNTPFQRAFWHAGVGMWQFDSAGGWNMTAAGAISTQRSSAQAAATMAARYCASSGATRADRMAYAWSLWYACVSGGRNLCLERFNEMFVNGTFTNIRRDPTVGRLGGMVRSTCRIGTSLEVLCQRVDPALAQGLRTWAAPGAGPTPLTAPFYVVVRDGREVRYWLSQDTGYPQTIIAHKPIRANARTSLTWSFATPADALCDLGSGRGACGAPRVASTPWGDQVGDPFGALDLVSAGAGTIGLFGWVIDPDTNDSLDLHLYIDGRWGGSYRADWPRPDVAAVVPGYGDAHGFAIRTPRLTPGPRTVCLYAINVGPFGTTNPLLGCRTVTVTTPPVGNLEAVQLRPGGLRASGWVGDVDASAPLDLQVRVDGVVAATGLANAPRPDVAAAYPALGSRTGFAIDVNLPAGPAQYEVCVNAGDVPSGERIRVGCTTLTTPGSNPVGNMSPVVAVPGGAQVRGWTLDPDSANALRVHLYVNGSFAADLPASAPRPHLSRSWPLWGIDRGFETTLTLPPGPATVCAYAINVGPGTLNPLLGCGAVSVPPRG